MLLADVEAGDVIQSRIRRFTNHRLVPRDAHLELLVEPGEDSIPHRADAVGVGDRDRPAQYSALLDPGRSGQIAESIAGVVARENRVPFLPAGQDDRDAGPNRLAAFSADDGGFPDLDAGNIGDGVEGSRGALEGYGEERV